MLGAVGHAKLEKFDGLGNVERFLDHFDVIAKANGWSEAAQILQMPTGLTGAAFDFYRRLLPEERDTVTKLKTALANEFGAGALESDYALMFAGRRRQLRESLPDFGEALKDLARKAYPSFTTDQLEKLCKTNFINGGLDELLRVQLLVGTGADKESYRDLISRARRLEHVLAPSRVRRIPDEQDSELKREVQKLTSVVAALEQKVAALAEPPGRKNQLPQTPCPVCGENGHWSRNCPKKTRLPETAVKRTDKIVCFKCKEPGHMARGCANF